MLTPGRLRCEYLVEALGIDARTPRLSWIVESNENGQAQSAYRITAATSETALVAAKPDLWDSGKVGSDETLHVPYAGCGLRSGQRVYWQVQVWDRDGNAASASAIAWFEMGLLEAADWQAHWIAGGQFDASPRPRRRSRSPRARRAWRYTAARARSWCRAVRARI